ncbi:MAG: glycoside hydrolase family 25 protein [Oscillospiraceae bacterium]|nr:glycoside hydrolase family 25 protein [Oscillospiraceae bacterium]
MNFKIVIPIAAAAVAAVSAIAVLGISNASKSSRIRQLEEKLEQLNVSDAENEEDRTIVYEPIEVNHYYERKGEKILLRDEQFGQIWLPVLSDVTLSSHPLDNMREQVNHRMVSFDDEGNINALTGIDISSHNTVTDWNAVKEDGIDFVMLRVGYRNYGTDADTMNPDTMFREYYREAKKVGLKVGAYFFSQAVSEEEAVAEAVYTAQLLEGCELDFPLAYDWEIIFQDTARTDNVPVDTLTDCVLAYCQNMESFGYSTMFYQNKRTTLFKLDLPRLKEIPMWLAEYGDGPTYIYDYDMWQYASDGTVAGISGKVDMNLAFYDFSQEGKPKICLPAENLQPFIEPKDAAGEEEAEDSEDVSSDEESEKSENEDTEQKAE